MTLQEFRQRYQYDTKTDRLGEGGFAKVYKATDTLMKRTVALKFYHGDSEDKYGVIEELKKVTKIRHKKDTSIENKLTEFGLIFILFKI